MHRIDYSNRIKAADNWAARIATINLREGIRDDQWLQHSERAVEECLDWRFMARFDHRSTLNAVGGSN